ncbi:hypothetical protein ACFVZW_00945 [Streptomyces sp. NPDC059567]|uniref:hypothetical protein n=1 Tax=Streptomyces sp. NPDC059567 TaxID=3346867 RepID=UPI00369A8EA6
MSSDQHVAAGVRDRLAEDAAESGARRPARVTGVASLLLGLGAVAMGGFPWLPEAVPPMVRYFPLYLIIPLGICAIVAGVNVLRVKGGVAVGARRRAWAGTALGVVAVVVPIAVVLWGIVMLGAH